MIWGPIGEMLASVYHRKNDALKSGMWGKIECNALVTVQSALKTLLHTHPHPQQHCTYRAH